MFLRYLDFIFAPFRAIQNKILGVQNIKGNIQVDINRSKAMANQGKQMAGQVGQFNQKLNQAAGQPGAPMQQQPGMPGAPGAPGAPGMPNPNPPIRAQGFWIFKKKFCTQCEQQLDKSWDACPFCAQIAVQAAAAPAKLQAMKT